MIKVEITLLNGLSVEESNRFWDDYLQEAIETNKFQYGGLNSGYIEPIDIDKVLDQNTVNLVFTWLDSRKEVSDFHLRLVE